MRVAPVSANGIKIEMDAGRNGELHSQTGGQKVKYTPLPTIRIDGKQPLQFVNWPIMNSSQYSAMIEQLFQM